MRRPVRPRPLQGHGNAPVAQPLHTVLRERGAHEVSTEPLEPRAIAGGDVHGRVQIEPGIVGVQRHVAVDPRRVRIGADSQRASSGSAPQCRAAQHRGLGQPGQRR